MTRPPGVFLAATLVLAMACAMEQPEPDTAATEESASDPVVVLETTRGTIVMELDRSAAPETVDNIVQHVGAGFYDGLIFHRIAPDFVIQTGAVDSLRRRRSSSVFPLANEAPTGLVNERGTVAMARTGDPHSATTEFFINLKDNPGLDFRDSTATDWGYAVFGRVVEGMDVVDAIAAPGNRPRARFREYPAEPVTIERAFVRSADGG